jgi:hypothetical protein
MKTNIRLRSYLAHFFLECEMFQTNVVEEMKPFMFMNFLFFPKIESYTK